MRKASQDGGDSTSITSGFENEYKKIGTGILKSTRNSLKKRVHSLSHESDDAVIEPLLQKDKDKDKVDIATQSAKYLLSKTKTEPLELKSNDSGSKVSQKLITTGSIDKQDATVANGVKDTLPKCMAANGHSYTSSLVTYSNGSIGYSPLPKTQILVDIEGHKTIGHGPSPLIFTTAKIHVDGKTKEMEPVHVTVGPILSTIEASKTSSVINNEQAQNTIEPQNNYSKKESVIKAVTNDIKLYSQASKTPDIVASTTKQPSIHKVSTFSIKSGVDSGVANAATNTNVSFSNQTQSTTAAEVNKITREKLEKLEAYLSKSESNESNVNKSQAATTDTKKIETDASGKSCTDKGIVETFKDSSFKSKDSKDTTIIIDPYRIGNKLDDLENIGMKNDKQAGKADSAASQMGSVDKKVISKLDAQISKDANKTVTNALPTSCVSDDKGAPKDTSHPGPSNKDLNKVGSIKQLPRQKKSKIDEANETDGKVKPTPSSTIATPTTIATTKTLPKVAPAAKKEVDSDKVGKTTKTSSVIAKDMKDNTKVQKASDASLIPIKTTKIMNVAATSKATTTAKSSTASTIKLTSSNVVSATSIASQETPTAKSTHKSTSNSTASSTVVPKNGVKTIEQNSKDGKPSKA